MTKHEIIPEGRKHWTDRDLLRSCLDAMKVAQDQSIPTDWRHMIAALDKHLGGAAEPRATHQFWNGEVEWQFHQQCQCARCLAMAMGAMHAQNHQG
jgi:hypothetical protein